MITGQITWLEFCKLVGSTQFELSDFITQEIKNKNFNYEILDDTKTKYLMRIVDERIKQNGFSPMGSKEKWATGWAENLKLYSQSNNESALIPKYHISQLICRLNGNYILPESPSMESDLCILFHMWLFNSFFYDVTDVFDFGCGTGSNLKQMRHIFPNVKLHGLDWVQETINIINLIKANEHIDIDGRLFDMTYPDYTLILPKESGVYTCGALEQLGTNYRPFLLFLLEKKPKIVCHLEPILEFYSAPNRFDDIAFRYHNCRGYLNGFYTSLLTLEREGRIKILYEHRNAFGSFYHEGYNILAWRPI